MILNSEPLNIADIIAQVSRHEENADFNYSENILILRNYTIEGLEPYLKVALYENQIKPVLKFAEFNTIPQSLLNKERISKKNADIILLSLTLDELAPKHREKNWTCTAALSELALWLDLALNKCNLPIIVNTFILPTEHNPSLTKEISSLNEYLENFCASHSDRFYLIDFNRYLRALGEANSIDYRFLYMNKAPFKPHFLALYAQEITHIIINLIDRHKKVLVIYPDNVLWGGVAKEKGLRDVQLSSSGYPGNIYYRAQQIIQNLLNNGVKLALAGSGDEAAICYVLENHPECILKRSDFSAIKLNDSDYSKVLTHISEDLELPLDTFSTLASEASIITSIKNELPMVSTIQVPTKTYDYPAYLSKQACFKVPQITLCNNPTKIEHAVKCDSLDDYLRSLELKVSISRCTDSDIARVTYLTQTTNQLNPCATPYTESEIKELATRTDTLVYSLRAEDRFDDYGLCGVCILKRRETEINVDTILIGCRILGKRLEEVFLEECISIAAQTWNSTSVNGRYVQTSKNGIARDFWERVGFTKLPTISKTNEYTRDVTVSSLSSLRELYKTPV